MQRDRARRWRRLLAWLLICSLSLAAAPDAILAASDQTVTLEPGERVTDSTEETEPTPEVTEEPEEEPEITETPAVTETPEVTVTPEVTEEPEEVPEVTEEPTEMENPEEEPSAKAAVGWKQNANGSVRYVLSNGTYAKNGWQKIKDIWYYFDKSGYLETGWITIASGTYYLKETGKAGTLGAMVTGWQDIGGSRFYFTPSGSSQGKMVTGWQTIGNYKYYFKASGGAGVYGRLWTGWLKQGGRIYYLKKTGDPGVMGRALTGWQTIGGKTFYFKATGSIKGAMFMGFQSISGQKYCFASTGSYGTRGVMRTGWQTIDKVTYFFREDGAKGVKGQALTGWQDIGKYRFYFKKTGTWQGKMLTGWQSINSQKYFFKRTGEYGIKGAMLRGVQSIDGAKYFFDQNGKLQSTYRTLKGLLMNAVQPVGTTLYIWGGGHDEDDATRIGVNAQWKKFFGSQTSKYDYTAHRYEYGNGLDCSGFVGWTVYNTVNRDEDGIWCTETSGKTGELYFKKGWGSYTKGMTSPSFRAGDVVGYDGHVWMVLGKCSDGSYVIVHSSPQGVKLGGTVHPKTGSTDSVAIDLARKYMKKYFSDYAKKFTSDGYICDNSYLKNSSSKTLYRFRWTVNGKGILTDPDGYASMSAEEILKDLFGA